MTTRFFDNVTGAQKTGVILIVLLIVVRIAFPEVAQWALDGIRDMTNSVMNALDLGE